MIKTIKKENATNIKGGGHIYNTCFDRRLFSPVVIIPFENLHRGRYAVKDISQVKVFES